MNTLDTVYLLIIGFFTITFAFKGIKQIIFTLISGALAAFISVAVGGPIAERLASFLIKIEADEPISLGTRILSQILPTTFGTLITFALLFIAIRLLLKLVEMRIATGVIASIVNRLIGGLVGFVLGVSIVFVFSSFFELFNGNNINAMLTALNESKIYSFLELFKIKF